MSKKSGGKPPVRAPSPLNHQLNPSQVAVTHGYSGPIPPPSILREFDSLIPGTAERIIRSFEQEQAHRQRVELDVASANIRIAEGTLNERRRGQTMAAGMGCLLLAATVLLSLLGHETVAGILGGTALVAVIGLFLNRQPPSKQ